MLGRMLCSLGLHRVVTTREGKSKTSAASFIHCFCYRPGCNFHEVIDTHTGNKDLLPPTQSKTAGATGR